MVILPLSEVWLKLRNYVRAVSALRGAAPQIARQKMRYEKKVLQVSNKTIHLFLLS